MRKIDSHLGSLYECPVSVMCRNISWKSDDLNNIHGIFNMLAFLDKPEDYPEYQAAFGGGGIDNNIYGDVDQLKEDIRSELDAVEGRMDTVEGRMEVVEKDVDKLKTRIDTLQNDNKENKERIEKVEEGLEKLSLVDNCGSSNNNNTRRGILRCETTVNANRVRVSFNMRATQVYFLEVEFSSEKCHYLSHPIKLEIGKTFLVGVLSTTWSRGGVLP